MNKLQKTIFIFTIAVDALMGLFPPWHLSLYKSDYNQFKLMNRGYAFIGTPPRYGSISISILLLQILIVTFVGLALFYYFKSKPSTKSQLPAEFSTPEFFESLKK
jgi:hypothetical protein